MKTIEVPRVLDASDEGRTESVVAVAGGSAASTPALKPKGKTLDEKAYNNGWNARVREVPSDACPHKPQGGLAFMWWCGWQDCHDFFKALRRRARQQNTKVSQPGTQL